MWGHKAQRSTSAFYTEPEAHAKAHNRIWGRQ